MICIVENCENKAISRGYCDKHRKQIKRHGRLTPETEHRKTCTIDGCERKHLSKGYCRIHYYKYIESKKIKSK